MTISTLVLILFFLGLAGAFAAIAALARQVGVLFERVAPAGALSLSAGPALGSPAPQFTLPSLSGATVRIGQADPAQRSQMILFVGPECPICKELIPAARSLAASEKAWLDVIYASDGGQSEQHFAYIQAAGLRADSYVMSQDLGLAYHVAKVPYAVLLDGEGVLRSRGMVNSREHLESLIEAKNLGVASLQEYLSNKKQGAL